MKKYLTVFASFVIMLCIGSIYAWSIIASELTETYYFSVLQTQIIFGTVIAVFPVTMIFTGQASSRRVRAGTIARLSGFLFLTGYLISSYSNGHFLMMLSGIGVLTGIATGFGYWVAFTTPIQWFPGKKGLITGIAAAGFGLGAVFMSLVSESILSGGKDVLQLLRILGISYGLIIILFSNFIYHGTLTNQDEHLVPTGFLYLKAFKKLFLGIFLGTFAGLLIIGNLKIIGEQSNISAHTLMLGVSLFAFANFSGRIIWGFLSDFIDTGLSISFALFVQSIAIVLLNIITLSDVSYLMLSLLTGLGFGGNFVLFAKETAQIFGVKHLGVVYPYVFSGYAIAGVAGPFSGGLLYDLSGTYSYAIFLAGVMSLAGSLLFFKKIPAQPDIHDHLTNQKNQK